MHCDIAAVPVAVDERILGPAPLVGAHAAPADHLLHATGELALQRHGQQQGLAGHHLRGQHSAVSPPRTRASSPNPQKKKIIIKTKQTNPPQPLNRRRRLPGGRAGPMPAASRPPLAPGRAASGGRAARGSPEAAAAARSGAGGRAGPRRRRSAEPCGEGPGLRGLLSLIHI